MKDAAEQAGRHGAGRAGRACGRRPTRTWAPSTSRSCRPSLERSSRTASSSWVRSPRPTPISPAQADAAAQRAAWAAQEYDQAVADARPAERDDSPAASRPRPTSNSRPSGRSQPRSERSQWPAAASPPSRQLRTRHAALDEQPSPHAAPVRGGGPDRLAAARTSGAAQIGDRGRRSRWSAPPTSSAPPARARSTARVSRSWAWAQAGVSLPHSASAQYSALPARAAVHGPARRHHLLRQLRPPRRDLRRRRQHHPRPSPRARRRGPVRLACTATTRPYGRVRPGLVLPDLARLRGVQRPRASAADLELRRALCARATRPPSWSSSTALDPVDAPGRPDVRLDRRGRRRGRPGRLGRRAAGPRRVRGPLVAADVDLPDPREHREDPRAARGAERPVRDARRRRPRRADVGPRRVRAPNGSWSTLPFDWRGMPEERVDRRTRRSRVIGRAIEALPPMQAEVIRLRDVLGWSSEEVRNALDLTDTNQRVLLHRARTKVRAAVGGAPEERERMTQRQIACREVLELISGYLDDALPADVHARGRGAPRRAATAARRCSRSSADDRDDRAAHRGAAHAPRSATRCWTPSAAGLPAVAPRSASRVSACWTSASFPVVRAPRRAPARAASIACRSAQLPVRVGRVLQLLVGLDDQLEDLLRDPCSDLPGGRPRSSCRSR